MKHRLDKSSEDGEDHEETHIRNLRAPRVKFVFQ